MYMCTLIIMNFIGKKIKHACKSTNKRKTDGGEVRKMPSQTTEFKIIIKMQRTNIINDHIKT